MRKILTCLLALSAVSAFAVENNQFQAFDNEANFGFGVVQSNSASGVAQNVLSTNNMINLEAERLLNNGIWLDGNFSGIFGRVPKTANNSNGINNYAVNGKFGYAFPFLNQHLQLTPYALAGISNNGEAGYNAAVFGSSNQSGMYTANQYFYTGGLGGRIEYRVNKVVLVYFDQSALYNWDQSSYTGSVGQQNNVELTSMLGAKFNVTDTLQLGVKGFYSYFDQQSCAGVVNGQSILQSQNGLGGLVTVGVTY